MENNQIRSDKKNCIYCNALIPSDSQFCQYCGKKQVVIYSNTFYRNGRDEAVFIQSINDWFAANRSAANIKAVFKFQTLLGITTLKAALDQFAIQYETLNGTNKFQYALYSLHQLQPGLPWVRNASSDDILATWKQNNPWAIVVDAKGVTHSKGDKLGLMYDTGVTSRKQWYILYKFDPLKDCNQIVDPNVTKWWSKL